MKKRILALLLAVCLVCCLAACQKKAEEPAAPAGSITVTVTVTFEDEETVHTLTTDKDTLGGVITECGIAEGTTEQYGLYIHTVDGHYADPDKGEYWVFTKGGEWVTTGADTTPIADGDAFEFFIYK